MSLQVRSHPNCRIKIEPLVVDPREENAGSEKRHYGTPLRKKAVTPFIGGIVPHDFSRVGCDLLG